MSVRALQKSLTFRWVLLVSREHHSHFNFNPFTTFFFQWWLWYGRQCLARKSLSFHCMPHISVVITQWKAQGKKKRSTRVKYVFIIRKLNLHIFVKHEKWNPEIWYFKLIVLLKHANVTYFWLCHGKPFFFGHSGAPEGWNEAEIIPRCQNLTASD
jgi:hypothetical protein